MLSRSIIKRLNSEDRNLVREGAVYFTLLTGGVAYWNYR
jgi:hypothetical protein